MTAPLTIAEAAAVARISEDEIRQALATGELRSLTLPAVDAWARARVAAIVARAHRS